MEKKKQHLVPKSYLNAWCDPTTPEGQTPYLWVFDKDGTTCKPKAPKKIFTETDPYTFIGSKGERDLLLEDRLSKLESEFAKVRREKLDNGRPLDASDRVVLLMFAAAMLNRTASQREHQDEQWKAALDMGEKLGQTLAVGNIPARPTPYNEPSLMIDEMQRIAEQPLQQTLSPFADATYEIFRSLDMGILEATTEPGFITSDTPCVVGASELDERLSTLYDSVLHLPSTEVYLPLSPRLCLFLSRSGFVGWHQISDVLLDEINRRMRFGCHRQFVVNQNFNSPYAP